MKTKNLIERFAKQSAGAVLALHLALTFPLAALAGPGHDHDDDHATDAPSLAEQASPRFVMSSELFEAVGIVKGNAIEIYVDHAKTNAPVENATLVLELNGSKVPVALHAAGKFDAALPDEMINSHSGSPMSVAMTINAGDQVDLLAGEIALAHGDEHQHELDAHSHRFEFAMYGLGGLILIALALIGVRWTRKNKQHKEGR